MFDQFDALLLARIQFAFTVSFHFIFPSFSIGLASYLAVLEGLWLKTGKPIYLDLFKFWLKIFAITFAMGVVSGIVMSYQFGTNWSVFSDRAGPVIGPLMAYEVLTAFFLEAGFLGVMLFGMNKVGKKLHFAATLMVAVGTFISAFWILSVNSWMQTPVGFEMGANGQFLPGDSWWAIVFNPSFPYRLFSGDLHGLNTLEHQPQKVMAMEGHYDSHPDGAPLILLGIPDSEEKRVKYSIEIPKLSSLILKHDLNAPLAGLDTIPDDEEPPVEIVFWSFRIMVAIGFAMLGLGIWSLFARFRKKLYDWKSLHRAALVMAPSGFVAVIAGWITTEVGRQPYVIYNLMRTADAASPLDAPAVGASLVAFVLVYFAVFGAGTWYILRLMSHSPHTGETGVKRGDSGPIRTAGITPGPAQNPGHADTLPRNREEAE